MPTLAPEIEAELIGMLDGPDPCAGELAARLVVLERRQARALERRLASTAGEDALVRAFQRLPPEQLRMLRALIG